MRNQRDSFTCLNDVTSLPQSQASQPASLAPHTSFLRSSPTWTASSGFTPNNSQAFKKIVGFGFSASTCKTINQKPLVYIHTHSQKVSDHQPKGIKEISYVTSAETATASNQSSHLSARRRGLNRVSKLDTIATFTPASLIALNTFSASGSNNFHAW